MLAGVDINGGLSWNGWQSRGFSNQLGVYGSGGTSEVYEVYTTTFAFNKASNTITGNPVQAVAPAPTGFSSGRLAPTPFGQVAVSAGAFANGNTILGVGVRVVSGGSVAGFKPTLRFDLDNDSYCPASKVGGTDGRTSFGSFSERGDFTVQFEGASSWRGSTISVQAGSRTGQGATYTGTNDTVLLPGGIGSGTSYDFAFRAFARTDANTYQMFMDMSAIPRLYGSTDPSSVYKLFFPAKAGVGSIADAVTLSLNGLGSNNVVIGPRQVSIAATDAIASEDPALGPDRGEFVISRGEGNVTGDLTVAIQVAASLPTPLTRATLTSDYTLSVGGMPLVLSPSGQGTVTIPAGKSSVAIRLAVAPDALLEWDETVRISLLPAPAGSTHYCISLASADVTILDDESIGGLLSRNVDPESTGLTASTIGHGAAAIDLATGEATVSLPLVLGSFGPQYTSHDNLRPIVALETQLPLATTGPVTATLTFGGIASEAVTFTGVPGNETVRFVLLGSDAIRSRLSTGRYDYDIALRDAEGRVRTIRGATEIVNRAEEAFGETEFGRRWWLPLLDRLVPGELDAHGVQWRSLGFFHVASGSTITIDVATSYPTATGQTAFADGFVVADAVMAVRKWTAHSR